LLEALGFDPIGLDDLIARTGRSAADLSARLLDLELAGRVARLPGQLFQRVERA
jgi:DNA processing protein